LEPFANNSASRPQRHCRTPDKGQTPEGLQLGFRM
jgi:hypothetical protein